MSETVKGDARREIMGRVRERLGVRGDEVGRRGRVQSRIRNAVANIIPERAKVGKSERIKLFQSMLETSGAEVSRVRTYKALPEVIAALLRDNNLPSRVRIGDDPIFAAFRAEPGLVEILSGPAQGDDLVSVSRAFSAAAETGTMFLISGKDNPSTLNFLPENHIVIIAADDIAGAYEESWAKIRSDFGAGKMPRTVNLISGPSRTADIEQTIVMGAHGPRKLFVLIAGS